MFTPLFYSKITGLLQGHFSLSPPLLPPITEKRVECKIRKMRTQFHGFMLSSCKYNKFGHYKQKTVDFHKYVQWILRSNSYESGT